MTPDEDQVEALRARAAMFRDLAGALDSRARSLVQVPPSPGPQPSWPALGAFRCPHRRRPPSGAPSIGQLPSVEQWHATARQFMEHPDEVVIEWLLRLADRAGIPHDEARDYLTGLLGSEAA